MVPTHAITVDGRFTMEFSHRLSTPAEDIGQMLGRMDGAEMFAVSLWPMPVGKRLDEFDHEVWSSGYIQCAGTANRLTVEIQKLDAGVPRQFVLGRVAGEREGLETVTWDSGSYSLQVRANELLDWTEATRLFVGYYLGEKVSGDFEMREFELW